MGQLKVEKKGNQTSFDMIGPFEADPFVGHLSTPITTSNFTITYLKSLPIYKTGLSPLLKGINIGFIHGYFLLGPFVKLGPLRESPVAGFIGFLATVGLLVILSACLTIYGVVSFKEKPASDAYSGNLFTRKQWFQFTSGFAIGGFGGAAFCYFLLPFFGYFLGN
jgi:photosystem I subunit 11